MAAIETPPAVRLLQQAYQKHAWNSSQKSSAKGLEKVGCQLCFHAVDLSSTMIDDTRRLCGTQKMLPPSSSLDKVISLVTHRERSRTAKSQAELARLHGAWLHTSTMTAMTSAAARLVQTPMETSKGCAHLNCLPCLVRPVTPPPPTLWIRRVLSVPIHMCPGLGRERYNLMRTCAALNVRHQFICWKLESGGCRTIQCRQGRGWISSCRHVSVSTASYEKK